MLYLIKRGPRPDYHRAPFHAVIICTKRKQAMWEAGSTSDHAWVWVKDEMTEPGGWLLCRWNGFDIDYGNVVHGITLPDGSPSAFWRLYDTPAGNVVTDIVQDATWWSTSKIPEWLVNRGVKKPDDDFTQRRISEWRDSDFYYLEPTRRLFEKSEATK